MSVARYTLLLGILGAVALVILSPFISGGAVVVALACLLVWLVGIVWLRLPDRGPMASIVGWALWSLGLPLAVLAVIFVAVPSLLAPLVDNAVSLGGLPAGPLFVGIGWLLIVVGGFAWIRLARREAPGLAASIAMVVWTVVVLVVSPAVVLIIKNMKV